MGPARLFSAAILAALAVSVLAARAGDEVSRPVAVGVKLAQSANQAELTFELSRPVEARAHTLASPDRIVIDLPETAFEVDPAAGQADAAGGPLVKAFRFGLLAPGRSRSRH